jgi:hypothetical protein
LSPCGDWDNSPSAIARRAKELGLDLIALTDHNSALNCPAFREACNRQEIASCYGLEITTREEVHILALFESVESALEMGQFVANNFPDIKNDPERFGDQIVVDHDDYVLDEVEVFLLSASNLSIEEIVGKTLSLGGLSIPAHIDRTAFSLGSQLGFVPDLPFSAVETVRLPVHPSPGHLTVISDSDAHYLPDVGNRYTLYEGTKPSFSALRTAIENNAVTTSLALS